jgi:AcrR family transcriptional regulator
MDRLPRGRHGLSPEFVARNQRERLIAGLTSALYEVGYQKTTVSIIGQRAAVSKSDFYKHFESKDECFIAAYDAAIKRMRGCVATACEEAAGEEWPRRVRVAIDALLSQLTEEPALASITLVEGLRAGREVYDRYQGALETFVGYLHEGAPSTPQGGEVPEATGEAVVGGIASLLGRRVLAGEAERLNELFPEILEFTLSAYLGAEQARRIISAE